MKADRLSSLTDAVVAIVATIMVLELSVPENAHLESITRQWPIFLAHFNSFFLIYILWYNHYKELHKFEFVSTKVVLLNGLWLALLAIIPFSTGWVGRFPDSTYPELLYLLVLALCFLVYHLILIELTKENPEYKAEEINSVTRRIPIYLGLLLAIIFAFFIPILSQALVFIIVLINIYQIIRYGGRQTSH